MLWRLYTERAIKREEVEKWLVESDATHCIDWMREHPSLFSFENAIEERSV